MITDILVGTGAVFVMGAWLKWASRPVLIAYWLGREVTHLIDRQETGRKAAGTRAPLTQSNAVSHI
jgi:hypothetical protein